MRYAVDAAAAFSKTVRQDVRPRRSVYGCGEVSERDSGVTRVGAGAGAVKPEGSQTLKQDAEDMTQDEGRWAVRLGQERGGFSMGMGVAENGGESGGHGRVKGVRGCSD